MVRPLGPMLGTELLRRIARLYKIISKENVSYTRIVMFKAKITTKGQTTIPKQIRLRLGLRPGDEIEFVEVDGEIVLRKRVRDSLFKEYRGYLKDLAGKDPDQLVEESRGR